jgi:HPt (histidine-containing phosphotransfer) domain-containing protein
MALHRSFSPEAALTDLRGSEATLRTMAETFLQTAHAALARTAQAQAEADPVALLREVHALRGSFAVLRAEPARALAASIHRMIDAGTPPSADDVDALLAEAMHLIGDLRAWLAAARPPG